jgi:hypothetical protein
VPQAPEAVVLLAKPLAELAAHPGARRVPRARVDNLPARAPQAARRARRVTPRPWAVRPLGVQPARPRRTQRARVRDQTA